MTQKICRTLCLLMALLLIASAAGKAWAQGGTRGTVVLTVTDPIGRAVQGAKLTIVDPTTKAVRSGSTSENGSYTFSGLLGGIYKLTIEKTGFAPVKYDAVQVEAARVTGLNVALKIGGDTEQVVVVAEASPLVEATSSSIGTNFDLKDIETLPFGEDVNNLTSLVPGAANGVFNGMRREAETSTLDGVVSSPQRFKGYGADPAVEARLENVDEAVVQTDQLDLNQGYGQANMMTGFSTRRGGDRYHGRVYTILSDPSLAANGYWNDYEISKGKETSKAARDSLGVHTLTWGPSVGGPIPIPGYKDKLFFFASYTRISTGGSTTATSYIPSANLQSGIFGYAGTDGSTYDLNLFTLAKTVDLGASRWYSANSGIATEISQLNTYAKAASYTGADESDPYNITDIKYQVPGQSVSKYPTLRLDYNATKNLHVDLALNENTYSGPNTSPMYPGDTDFESKQKNKTYTAALGVDWVVNSQLVNQLRGGYLYYYNSVTPTDGDKNQLENPIEWDDPQGKLQSPQLHVAGMSVFYPQGSLSDNLVWQHGSHNTNLGVSWYREQDHYWNQMTGYTYIDMGMGTSDPAINAFTGPDSGVSTITMPNSTTTQNTYAQAYYAMLAGRLSDEYYSNVLNTSTKTYLPGRPVWDEVQGAFGIYAQDSWRITPSLTLNYGMRWDFTGDDYDKAGNYYTLNKEAVWGLSGYKNQFNPGSFTATDADLNYTPNKHIYSPTYVSPQPSVALAWNPHYDDGILGKLLGGSSTVIRAGYALRNYTNSEQNVYDFAQQGTVGITNNNNAASAEPVNGVQATGTYTPGTYAFGDTIPDSVFSHDVTAMKSSFSESSLSLENMSFTAIDKHIRQPYVQSWNLGIQRQLGKDNALEIRYVGNHSSHEWIPIDPNEVNVFENGFLAEFEQAQANAIASGYTSFQGDGTKMPFMTAAFGSDATQWTNGTFMTDLQNGKVGDFANTLAGTNYFCNWASGMSSLCKSQLSISGGNGAYPSNYFQANPYATGTETKVLVSEGSSNYHSLQAEFRQKNFHGASFTANYTFAKAEGVRPLAGGDSANFYPVTMRNMHLSYTPADSDIRQIFHLYGTYDLPFGKGKTFLGNANGLVNRLVGDWTVGTITTMKTGLPFLLSGGNHTYNDYTDGGIVLNNVTLKQLRKSVGVWNKNSGSGAFFINPKYRANSNYLTPNTTPGTIGLRPWLWGPHAFTSDMQLTKTVPIKEGLKFYLAADANNVFNHTTWVTNVTPSSNTATFADSSVANVGTYFGYVSGTSGASSGRYITLRANFEF
jgi:hypothetical protein